MKRCRKQAGCALGVLTPFSIQHSFTRSLQLSQIAILRRVHHSIQPLTSRTNLQQVRSRHRRLRVDSSASSCRVVVVPGLRVKNSWSALAVMLLNLGLDALRTSSVCISRRRRHRPVFCWFQVPLHYGLRACLLASSCARLLLRVVWLTDSTHVSNSRLEISTV